MAKPSIVEAMIYNVWAGLSTASSCAAAVLAPTPLSITACAASAFSTAQKIEKHLETQRREAAEAALLGAASQCRSEEALPVLTADQKVACWRP